MKKAFLIVLTSLAVLGVVAFCLRFLIGGPEDTWICENGEWVKHGKPSAPAPIEPCGDKTDEEKPVVCTMDAKLCSDGSYVSRIAPECNFSACPKEDLIQVENLQANEVITSPLTINGKARGFWFFEASFPVKLYDENGELLATAIAQAKIDQNDQESAGWMTEDFVEFSAELNFELSKITKGTLVLEKDNPSGLPQNADELRIPVMFSSQTKKINLYYYNPELDKDDSGNVQCSRDGLVEVEREIAITETPIQDAIKLLISGQLTDQEKLQGITTEYPLEGFSLKGASTADKVLTLEFLDLNNKASGGSCRAGILWFQIEATAMQFPEVEKVRFIPEDIFQP
jgi:hypothetical protein